MVKFSLVCFNLFNVFNSFNLFDLGFLFFLQAAGGQRFKKKHKAAARPPHGTRRLVQSTGSQRISFRFSLLNQKQPHPGPKPKPQPKPRQNCPTAISFRFSLLRPWKSLEANPRPHRNPKSGQASAGRQASPVARRLGKKLKPKIKQTD